MGIIEISRLTKDYGQKRGVFDLDLTVEKGEVFGFLGPNGAGKTTTIRQLLGLIRPDKGSASIKGLDCFTDAARIAENLGYLPGELAMMDGMTGRGFLTLMAEMKGIKDRARMEELIEYFELDTMGKVRRMSKGMKQKLGIINAFMGRPDVLILDEPTSGLDPLMQNRFVELIREEKNRGTTIFMSSHMLEEIEKTCGRAAIIRRGRIVDIQDMAELRHRRGKRYMVEFASASEAERFWREQVTYISDQEGTGAARSFSLLEQEGSGVTIQVREDFPGLLALLSGYPVAGMRMQTQTLEELFLHYYGGDQ